MLKFLRTTNLSVLLIAGLALAACANEDMTGTSDPNASEVEAVPEPGPEGLPQVHWSGGLAPATAAHGMRFAATTSGHDPVVSTKVMLGGSTLAQADGATVDVPADLVLSSLGKPLEIIAITERGDIMAKKFSFHFEAQLDHPSGAVSPVAPFFKQGFMPGILESTWQETLADHCWAEMSIDGDEMYATKYAWGDLTFQDYYETWAQLLRQDAPRW